VNWNILGQDKVSFCDKGDDLLTFVTTLNFFIRQISYQHSRNSSTI